MCIYIMTLWKNPLKSCSMRPVCTPVEPCTVGADGQWPVHLLPTPAMTTAVGGFTGPTHQHRALGRTPRRGRQAKGGAGHVERGPPGRGGRHVDPKVGAVVVVEVHLSGAGTSQHTAWQGICIAFPTATYHLARREINLVASLYIYPTLDICIGNSASNLPPCSTHFPVISPPSPFAATSATGPRPSPAYHLPRAGAEAVLVSHDLVAVGVRVRARRLAVAADAPCMQQSMQHRKVGLTAFLTHCAAFDWH